MLEHATENEMDDERNIPHQVSLHKALRSFKDKLTRKDRSDSISLPGKIEATLLAYLGKIEALLLAG